MAEKSETRRILLRAVLAMGLAAGITMALFGLLGIAREWPAALGVAGTATALLCVRARWPKAGAWLLGCAGAAGLRRGVDVHVRPDLSAPGAGEHSGKPRSHAPGVRDGRASADAHDLDLLQRRERLHEALDPRVA